MPGFTYDQCDRIYRKIHNFDNIINQFYEQNYQSVTGKQLFRQKYISGENILEGKKKVDLNTLSRQRLMRNYESGMGKENHFEKGINQNSYTRKYEQKMMRYPLEERNTWTNSSEHQSLHASNQSKLFKKNISLPQQVSSYNIQFQQYSTIHPQKNSHEPSRYSHTTLLDQGYAFQSVPPQIQSCHQKEQTIHELNSQIKKIMTKYDYEFSNQEVKALVANDCRITLPSFRNEEISGDRFREINLKRKNQIMDLRGQEKKSSGFIKVEESISEQEIKLFENSDQTQNNQFSPYSDDQNKPKLNQKDIHLKQPAMKKQSTIIKNIASKRHDYPLNLKQTSSNSNNIFGKIRIQPSKKIPRQQNEKRVKMMRKSQLIEDQKYFDEINLNGEINLNRGYNQLDKKLEGSQKKKDMYMEGYLELKKEKTSNHNGFNLDFGQNIQKRANRIMSGSLGKNDRSEYLDRSIQELNERILQFEEKKKKLNINFKPFNLQQFKHKLHHQNHVEFQIRDYPSFEIKKQTQEKQIKQTQRDQNRERQTILKDIKKLKDQSQYNIQEQLSVQKIETQNQIDENSKIKHSNDHQVECQIEKVFSNVQLCQQKTNRSNATSIISATNNLSIVSGTNTLTIHKRNSQSPQTFKQALQQYFVQPLSEYQAPKSAQKRLNRRSILIKKPQNTKNAFELFLINIVKQIELDQDFRNLKTWFQFYFQEKEKWKEFKILFGKNLSRRKESLMVRNEMGEVNKTISEELKNEQVMIEVMENDEKEIEKVFAVTVNEHDPFFNLEQFKSQDSSKPSYFVSQHKLNSSSSQSQTQPLSMVTLLQKYETSQMHWIKNHYKKFSSQQLINSGFSSSSLDLQKKGFIQIQDMVRLINMTVGSGYRNRDLMMVWERVLKVKEREMNRVKNSHESSPKSLKIQFRYLLMTFAKKERI